MEIIDELEPVRRGPSTAGAVGYVDFAGNMDCLHRDPHGWWRRRRRLRAGGRGHRRATRCPRRSSRSASTRRARVALRRARRWRKAMRVADVLVIDNYDSFTYNLVQYLGELGAEAVRVIRNDAVDVGEIRRSRPARSCISPGPGTPDDAGVSRRADRGCRGDVPLLGVCLGHQAIRPGLRRAGRARAEPHARQDVADRTTTAGASSPASPNPFEATRYHSLVVERASLPAGPRGDGVDRRRRDHGARAPRAAALTACSSTPRRADPGGQAPARQLPRPAG